MKKLFTAVALVFFMCTARAQQENAPGNNPPPSYGKLSLNYTTNSVYNGRKDSVAIPYITPVIGYYTQSGFFIEGSFSWLPASGSRIDLFSMETGYDFSVNHFDGEIVASKNFYNGKSTNVRSEIQGGLGATAGYDFGFIHPSVQGQLNFGRSTDYTASFGLDHSFYLANDRLDITPSFLMNASTENYYGNYYSKRKYAGLKKSAGGGAYYDITADLSDATRFKLLDYEFSVPVRYTVKSFTFGFTPFYALPVNPAVVTVTVKSSNGGSASRAFTEKTGNSFYTSFEISYKF
jgi:hypothetical protein